MTRKVPVLPLYYGQTKYYSEMDHFAFGRPFFQACPGNDTNGVISYTFKSIRINKQALTQLRMTCPTGGQMVMGENTLFSFAL